MFYYVLLFLNVFRNPQGFFKMLQLMIVFLQTRIVLHRAQTSSKPWRCESSEVVMHWQSKHGYLLSNSTYSKCCPSTSETKQGLKISLTASQLF